MKKIILINTLLISFVTFSQITPKLPQGYKLTTDMDQEAIWTYTEDFDLDGNKDFAGVITKEENDEYGDKEVFIYLTSNQKSTKFPLTNDFYEFEFINNVLTIKAEHIKGYFSDVYKFKYYSEINDLRLIGCDQITRESETYDEYNLSVNFLTNKAIYTKPGRDKKTKKKIKVSKNIITSFPIIKIEDMNQELFDKITELQK